MTIQDRIFVLVHHGYSRDSISAMLGISPAEVGAVANNPEAPVAVPGGGPSVAMLQTQQPTQDMMWGNSINFTMDDVVSDPDGIITDCPEGWRVIALRGGL